MTDVDDILKRIGQYGKYQRIYTFFYYLPAIIASTSTFVTYFTIPAQNHRCSIPSWPGDTYHIQNESHSITINQTIPWVEEDGSWRLDECRTYMTNNDTYYNQSNNVPFNTSTQRCSSFVYDKTYYGDTITQQFNVVCEKKTQRSFAQVFFMVGILLGAITVGQLSDLIGRKKSFLICNLALLITSTVGTFMTNYWAFCVFRLLTGAANTGTYLTTFVMCIELLGPDSRLVGGLIQAFFFALGYFPLTLAAYYISDWKILTYVAHLPAVLMLLYAFFTPESYRWLISKGRYEEAEAIIRKMAKVNGKENEISDFSLSRPAQTAPVKSYSLIDVFRSRVLLLRALNVFFNWFVNTMVYYGLTLNSGNLGGSPHVNLLISGAVEVLAIVLCYPVMRKLGRKWPLCLSMVIGGIACISTLFLVLYGDPDNDKVHNALLVTLSMTGKCMISASFTIIYIFTAELFPTVVRNACVGASSMCARFGGILSPIIADIGLYVTSDFGQALPQVIFGCLSILAGVAAMILPETTGKELPTTIEEGEQFGRKQRKSDKYEEKGSELKSTNSFNTNSQITLISRSDL